MKKGLFLFLFVALASQGALAQQVITKLEGQAFDQKLNDSVLKKGIVIKLYQTEKESFFALDMGELEATIKITQGVGAVTNTEKVRVYVPLANEDFILPFEFYEGLHVKVDGIVRTVPIPNNPTQLGIGVNEVEVVFDPDLKLRKTILEFDQFDEEVETLQNIEDVIANLEQRLQVDRLLYDGFSYEQNKAMTVMVAQGGVVAAAAPLVMLGSWALGAAVAGGVITGTEMITVFSGGGIFLAGLISQGDEMMERNINYGAMIAREDFLSSSLNRLDDFTTKLVTGLPPVFQVEESNGHGHSTHTRTKTTHWMESDLLDERDKHLITLKVSLYAKNLDFALSQEIPESFQSTEDYTLMDHWHAEFDAYLDAALEITYVVSDAFSREGFERVEDNSEWLDSPWYWSVAWPWQAQNYFHEQSMAVARRIRALEAALMLWKNKRLLLEAKIFREALRSE